MHTVTLGQPMAGDIDPVRPGASLNLYDRSAAALTKLSNKRAMAFISGFAVALLRGAGTNGMRQRGSCVSIGVPSDVAPNSWVSVTRE